LSIATPQSSNLADTISAGYRALNRRPWALIVPVGLSAYLWLGSPVGLGASASELQQAAALLGGRQQAQADLAGRLASSDARVLLAWLNLTPVLAPAGPAGAAALQLGGPLALASAALLVNLLALLLSSLFLTALGSAVRNERLTLLAWLGRSLRVGLAIGQALLAVLGVGLVLGLPFIAISAIVIASLPGAATPVLLAWYIALFWVYVYAGFVPEAILISQSGPLRAIYNSVNIVRRNIGATLGLLLLSFLIISGLGVLWQQLARSPLGLAAAILGSAYIGGGLSAARLEFYRDRLARWQGRPGAQIRGS
jgi:hypothetical protein